MVIDILLTNLELLTLFALWLDTANLRGKLKTGVSTVIIAIRHNAKLNYLNRNITKDALNFYAVNPRKWWREVKKKLTGQSVNEPFAALIHTSYDSESAISSIFATMLMVF